jgi:protein-disulfide isomerase
MNRTAVLTVVFAFALTGSAALAADPRLEARVNALEQKVAELQKELETLKKAPPSGPARDAALQDKAHTIPAGDSPVLGNRQAKVSLVVFSDLQCPFCARSHEFLKEVTLDPELGPRVNVVYKHFPLSFHKEARPAAMVAMAVRELGGDDAFWRFIDLAYQNQRDLQEDGLTRLATAAGVDGPRATALAYAKESTYQSVLDADQKLATSIGVRGTPTFFVGGWQLATRSVDGVKALLREKNLR